MNLLTTEDIIGILRSDLPRIAPSLVAARENSIASVEQRKTLAKPDDALARSLRDSLTLSSAFIVPEFKAKLDAVTLYTVDAPEIGALARQRRGKPEIILFAGLLRYIQFFFEMIAIGSLLQAIRPDAKVSDGLDGHHEESFLFLLACQVLMTAFVEKGSEPPRLNDLLGENISNSIATGFNGALCFLLLHELGHIELGHTRLSGHAEPLTSPLLLDEAMSTERLQEFEADGFALGGITPRFRAGLISSLIHLFGGFAMLEAFTGALGARHPLSLNRLNRLAEACDLDETERRVTTDFVNARLAFFRQLQPHREAANGSVSERIYQVMSVSHALNIIAEVKRRVAHDHGSLDRSPISSTGL
ncbi:MAG: hypothetical protein AAFY42_00485 [Pseudomonadota bacterium]